MQLSELEMVRRENLRKIREMGIDPYPAEAFPVSHTAQVIHETFTEDEEGNPTNLQEVSLTGRLMVKRIMGKASFGELQDSSGRIQIYVSRDDIAPGEDKSLYNDLYKKLLDIG
ncbi:MAG: lysine--tRNA ligase, partial [Lewinella sp.]|nr:lysine--tRNA ligase [Lewinella sp.]